MRLCHLSGVEGAKEGNERKRGAARESRNEMQLRGKRAMGGLELMDKMEGEEGNSEAGEECNCAGEVGKEEEGSAECEEMVKELIYRSYGDEVHFVGEGNRQVGER